MAYLLNRIKESLAKEGLTPRTNQARAWLRMKIKDLKPTRAALLKDRDRLKERSVIGKMYFYFYVFLLVDLYY